MIRSSTELLGRKVALFGLSANPPTGQSGHLGIVKFLVETGLFDEVWVLPVYQHMFAAKRSMELFEHRVEMCRVCMEDESTPMCRVRVMMIEKFAAEYYEQKEGKEFRVGTVDILDYIHDQCPGLDLHLVLGTDTYKDLISRRWKQADRILRMVTVHAISRLGIETTGMDIVVDSCLISIDASCPDGSTSSEPEKLAVKVVHHKVPWLAEVSSSLVRRISSSIGIDLSCLVSKGGVDEELSVTECIAAMQDLLDPRVLNYIKEHNLYGYGNSSSTLTEKQVVSAVTCNTNNGNNSWGKIQSPEKPLRKANIVTQDSASIAASSGSIGSSSSSVCSTQECSFQSSASDDLVQAGVPLPKKVRIN